MLVRRHSLSNTHLVSQGRPVRSCCQRQRSLCQLSSRREVRASTVGNAHLGCLCSCGGAHGRVVANQDYFLTVDPQSGEIRSFRCLKSYCLDGSQCNATTASSIAVSCCAANRVSAADSDLLCSLCLPDYSGSTAQALPALSVFRVSCRIQWQLRLLPVDAVGDRDWPARSQLRLYSVQFRPACSRRVFCRCLRVPHSGAILERGHQDRALSRAVSCALLWHRIAVPAMDEVTSAAERVVLDHFIPYHDSISASSISTCWTRAAAVV